MCLEKPGVDKVSLHHSGMVQTQDQRIVAGRYRLILCDCAFTILFVGTDRPGREGKDRGPRCASMKRVMRI